MRLCGVATALVLLLFSVSSLFSQSAGGPAIPPKPGVNPSQDSTRQGAPSSLDGLKTEQLKQLMAKAMEIQVVVQVGDHGEISWSSQQSRITVNGLGISMRLEAENLLIVLELTPYRKQGDVVYLLVKGQIWLRSEIDGSLQCHSTIKGINAILGEQLTFYPLGRPLNSDTPAISMLIVVKSLDAKRTQEVLDSLAHQPGAGTGATEDSPASGSQVDTGKALKGMNSGTLKP